MNWGRIIELARRLRPARVRNIRFAIFHWTVASYALIYGFLKWGAPFISRRITGMPFPLPTPGTLMFFYMTLTTIAVFIYVTSSEEKEREFIAPVSNFLRGGHGIPIRNVVLALIPLLAGWQVYDTAVPKTSSPISLWIQHPSSNFPKKMETLRNPYENPDDAAVDAFIERARGNKVEFIKQVTPDVERWLGKNPNSHMLGFFPPEKMKAFLDALKAGNPGKDVARAALREKNLFEGRALYAMNCRACHGDSVSGDGPMADGFKLRPVNFTDNGTIETIVEGYTFWRVAAGGRGLPAEATPWDSAMPTWELNLTEEERWKILLAEYDLAQKTPRIRETVEAAGGAAAERK